MNDPVFKCVNPNVVNRLRQDGEIRLPARRLDVPKDEKWNAKQLTAKILQGIENGSSVQDISTNLLSVIGNNEASAIRNARTMVTSAENHGRLDSYEELSGQGVVMKKRWKATPDDRTRPSHINMDGEEQDLDKKFSNGCMFPGDGNGPSEEVWMCRCSMGVHFLGFRRKDGSFSEIDYERDETMHDRQIKEQREVRTADVSINAFKGVINGKDISESWTRRPDRFNFEIEDVINAQGFDGLPNVVDAEEFDRYVQEANGGNGLIAMRGYSAPDQDTLAEYQNQLYNGKWYVDCSEGGHAYGQGMYGAYNYGTEAIDAVKGQAGLYGNTSNGIIETFTLDPSAKIITASDSRKLLYRMQEYVDANGNRPYEDFNEGSICALFGYDAIVTGNGAGEIVVLNRTKIIFKKG